MKKILLSALVSTVFSASVLANAPHSCFNGAYLGAGLNYSQEKYQVSADVSGPLAGPVGQRLGLPDSDSVKLSGGGLKFFGGYGALISQGFYLGGELGLGFDRIVGSNKNRDLKSNNRVNYSIAARLGFAIQNVLPFLKVGYEGRPSLKTTISGTDITIKRNGFILGGGVDVAVTKNVFIRAEYVHGFGATSKKSLDVSPIIPAPAGSAVINGKVKFTSDTFMLGAAYKF